MAINIVNTTINSTKSLYGRIFPLTSLRRFIADQIIIWSVYFGYYFLIIGTISLVSLFLFYCVGYIFEYIGVLVNSNNDTTMHILRGTLISIAIGVIVIMITAVIYWIYTEDYKPWISMSEIYQNQVIIGIRDEEIADDIPINQTKCNHFWNCFLPIGSLRRYLSIRFVYTTIGLIICITYGYLSVLLLRYILTGGSNLSCPERNKPNIPVDCPILFEFLISLSLQLLLFLIIFGIVALLSNSCLDHCKKAWRIHVSRTHSANAHKST